VSAKGETTSGRGKEGDDASWNDAQKIKKIHTVDSVGRN
jgi:hypothetical protein